MCRKDLIRGRFRAGPINLEKIQFKYNSEAVYRGSASGKTGCLETAESLMQRARAVWTSRDCGHCRAVRVQVCVCAELDVERRLGSAYPQIYDPQINHHITGSRPALL